MTINFDMDGTIADLYGVENWLDYLLKGLVYPYAKAKPMLHFSSFARKLNQIQKKGHRIVIISWLSKKADEVYCEAIRDTKKLWLKKHLPSVKWDDIIIVPYGTPKENYCFSTVDILFDDEEYNRKNWKGEAFKPEDIMKILKTI